MTQKTFLFDMDEVLVSLIPHWLRYLNHKYGTNAVPADVTSWIMNDAKPFKDLGLTAAQVCEVFDDPDFWDTAPAVPGLHAFIECMMLKHTKWYIATSPANGLSAQCKIDWVTRELGKTVARDHLIITSSKEAIYGDLLVDDRDDNVVKYLDRWHTAQALVPLYPHVDKSKLLRFGDRVAYLPAPTVGDPVTRGPMMFRQILDKVDDMLGYTRRLQPAYANMKSMGLVGDAP